MCTYGLERYFHFTWTTTLLIKVWLDVIFKSLGCHQKVSLVWFGGFVWFFFHLMLFICWFNCDSQPSLGCDLWVWLFFFLFHTKFELPLAFTGNFGHQGPSALWMWHQSRMKLQTAWIPIPHWSHVILSWTKPSPQILSAPLRFYSPCWQHKTSQHTELPLLFIKDHQNIGNLYKYPGAHKPKNAPFFGWF